MTINDNQDSAALHRNGTEEATDLATAAFSFLTRWNAEILSLYGKRMQEYGLLPFNFALCTSQDDFADLQDEFYAALQADYREATANLAAAVAQVGKTAQKKGEGYANVLLKAQDDARAIIDQAKEQARRIIEEAESRARTPAAEPGESAAA